MSETRASLTEWIGTIGLCLFALGFVLLLGVMTEKPVLVVGVSLLGSVVIAFGAYMYSRRKNAARLAISGRPDDGRSPGQAEGRAKHGEADS